jgi:hypothetical protein
MMAEDATPLIDALLAIIDAARAPRPAAGSAARGASEVRCGRRANRAPESRFRRPRRQPKPTSGRGDNQRYLKPSIHSVSACEPRPSAASIAALYPRLAWSLDTTPLVRGFSSRSARKPATASEKWPTSTQTSARHFAQVSCSSRLFMRPTVRRAGSYAKRQSRQAGAVITTRGSRSERDRRHSVSTSGRV